MRRLRAATCLALAIAIGGVASASAAEVRIVPLSGPAKTLSLESLAGEEDVVDRSYTLRSTNGETKETVTGFSLGSLLNAADVDVFTFSYVAIPRPGGGTLFLDNEQVRDSESFDGPPVVYAGANDTAALIRPATGANDVNAPDAFSAAPLVITLRSGRLIEVEAKASAVKVDPGDRVTFTATATRFGAGQDLEFSWQFNDGSRGSGPTVSHRFKEPGSYDVVVGATSASDETGGSDVISIQVGKPRKGGPDRRGGGTNRDDDAPDSGRSDGPGSSTGPSGSGSSGGGGTGASTQPSGSQQTPPAPEPDRDESQQPTGPGEMVEGELVDGLGTVVAVEPEANQAAQPVARTGTPSDTGGGGLSEGVVAALLCGGLLGLGVMIETERLTRLTLRRI